MPTRRHFDESKHERYPEGDSRGGQFAPKSSLSNSLRDKIASGALDIPKDIKKRRFTVQSHDEKMTVYSEKVWEEIKAEMKGRGLSDEDIKAIEDDIYSLLSDNRQPDAKTLAAALLVDKGMTPENAEALIKKEIIKRGGFYGAVIDYKENFNNSGKSIDEFIKSEEGFAFYQKYSAFGSNKKNDL